MAQQCRTSGCTRIGQASGFLKGFCCSWCNIMEPGKHAYICELIEEAEHDKVVIEDNIILGYD